MAVGLVACAPALDWREVEHPAAGIVALFPCRPQHHSRSVKVHNVDASMHLLTCSADRQTFGISYIEIPTAEATAPILAAVRAAATGHIKPTQVETVPLNVVGATLRPGATRTSIDGTTANGERMHLEVGVFASALRVYQATVFAPERNADAMDTFFAGIKVR